jgi:hypothetical protein
MSECLSYERCRDFLGRRIDKRLCHNTIVADRTHTASPHYDVVLYGTAVLKFFANGVVQWFTDGYRTATTMQRMNQFGPLRVSGPVQTRTRRAVPHWTIDGDAFHEGYTWRQTGWTPFLPEWRTRDTLGLLEQAQTDWSAAPPLADALRDAGCCDEAVLSALADAENPSLGRYYARRLYEMV